MASTNTNGNWKLSEFVAHGSNVNCLSLSPNNGHMLATGGDDRKINLWLIGKPNNIMSISGMTSPVQSVVFNNSENWLGAGSKSGVVKVFDLEENRAIRSISGHKAAICSLDFHGYGDILASGSMDTNLKVWDVRRKGCIFTYKGHTEAIKDIQFSPDGKWLVSASSDCTVKIWDLSAGRLLTDFKTHSKAATSVQFHPRELLLASGSMDRTVKFYDMDQFSLISETTAESNGVRKILFHPDGNAIFTGTEESLKVQGWEPAKTYDMLPVHWGKVEDMTVSRGQLIAVSSLKTNVSVWCIDIKTMRPFSGETATSPTETEALNDADPRPFTTTSGRRLFEYERKPKEISPPSSARPGHRDVAENGKEAKATEGSNEEEGSPPTQIKDTERKEIFAARQKLIRTPPKNPFTPSTGADDLPFHYPPPSSSHQAKLDQVQYIPNLAQPESRQASKQPAPMSKPYQNGSALAERRLHGNDDPVTRPVQSVIPKQASEPYTGGDRPSAKQSGASGRGVGEIITNHVDVSQLLKNRLSALRDVRAEWTVHNPKVSLEVAINSSNHSVLVDLLNILHLKRTLWTLDMALIVLPELKLLIRTKYAVHVGCGCNVAKLILKSFGPVIKTNLAAPPQGGRDIQRDQRYEKCQSCHAHLISLREEVSKIVRESSTSVAGKVIRERALIPAFHALD